MTGSCTRIDQRFYASSYGRFNTPGPYVAGGAAKGSASNPEDPGSWNRYAYVEGDPVNKVDPSGLFGQNPCVIWGSMSWMCDPFSGLSGDPPSFPLTCMANPSGCVEQLGVELGGTGGGASLPFPQCNPGNSTQVANNLDFISTNYAAAQQISQQSGVPVDWLLGWTALESSATSPAGNLSGIITQAQYGDNNFLGQTASGWAGQTACPVTVAANAEPARSHASPASRLI
jgi:RHS repeat-associated protein